MTRLRSGSATDIGRNPRRTINQDMILETDSIFAVADGMGGHLGGEVASMTAIQALKAAFRRDEGADGLERAIEAAHEAVTAQARSSADLHNMGTTLAAVALVDHDGDELLAVANIGDSRIYLLRDGELSQLTDDHSLPQELYRQGRLTEAEAAADPRRNIVTRVLGPTFGEGPDMQNLIPYVGDRILICSDGLYNEVDDAGIARVLRTVPDPTDAARRLVEDANAHGGSDNVSVIVVEVVDDDGRARDASASLAREPAPPTRAAASPTPGRLMTADERNEELRHLGREDAPPTGSWEEGGAPDEHVEPRRRLTGRVIAFVVILLLVAGAGAAAVGFYARGAYYVGVDEGQVAIFKGRPGGLLWFTPTVEERTGIPEAAVPPARVDDVAAGHQVATIDEARAYVRALGDDTPAVATTDTTPTSDTTATTDTTATVPSSTP